MHGQTPEPSRIALARVKAAAWDAAKACDAIDVASDCLDLDTRGVGEVEQQIEDTRKACDDMARRAG